MNHKFDRDSENKLPKIGFIRETFYGDWWIKTNKWDGFVRCSAIKMLKYDGKTIEVDLHFSERIELHVDFSGKSSYHVVKSTHEKGLIQLKEKLLIADEENNRGKKKKE